MPKRTLEKLTKRRADAAQPNPNKDVFLWCGGTPGFGLRVYPSGVKIFIAQVRVGRTQRRVKIGPFGPFTVEQARERADAIIRAAAEGRDAQAEKIAAREAQTVGEVCDLYMKEAKAGRIITARGGPKKQSTVAIDAGRVERHVKPLIGNVPANALTKARIQRMVDDIAAGKTAVIAKSGKARGKAVVTGGAGTAARVLEMFGGIWSWAAKRGYVADGTVARGVDKAKGQAKTRVLDETELGRLGKAIAAAEGEMPLVTAALRLIALTGARREEIAGLRWSEVDCEGSCLRLQDSKAGRSTRALGGPAVAILTALADKPLHDTYVFPSTGSKGSIDLKKRVASIFDAAGLADARSHDLRRTFATIAADLEYSDATIGTLLGHAGTSVAARHYIRRPDGALIAAADTVARKIDAALANEVQQRANNVFD